MLNKESTVHIWNESIYKYMREHLPDPPPPPWKVFFKIFAWYLSLVHRDHVISVYFSKIPIPAWEAYNVGWKGEGCSIHMYQLNIYIIASIGFCYKLCMVSPILLYIWIFLAHTAQIVSKPCDSIYVYLLPFRESSSFWNKNNHCLSFGNELFSM